MSYYVYQLIDPRTTEPFYVGKGKGKRMYAHIKEAQRGVHSRKCDLIRELIAAGLEIGYHVISWHTKEQEAYDAEARLVESIGLHRLTNVVAGGGGVPERKVQGPQSTWGADKSAISGLASFFRQSEAGNDIRLAGRSLYQLAIQSVASLIKDYGAEKVEREFSRYKIELNMRGA